MEHHLESSETPSSEKKPVRGKEEKKNYSAPELLSYGDFSTLTQGGGGTNNEPGPGNPNTRLL